MEAGIEVLTLGAAGICVYLLVSSLIDLRVARHFRMAAHTERTRTQWAEARALLFDLVKSGQLDVRSETFRTFYGLQTLIMRRPDEYSLVSRKLANAIIENPKAWVAEAHQWPAEMIPVLERMSVGTVMIAFGFPDGKRRLMKLVLFKVAPVVATLAAGHAFARLVAFPLRLWPALRSAQQMIGVQSRLDAMRATLQGPVHVPEFAI